MNLINPAGFGLTALLAMTLVACGNGMDVDESPADPAETAPSAVEQPPAEPSPEPEAPAYTEEDFLALRSTDNPACRMMDVDWLNTHLEGEFVSMAFRGELADLNRNPPGLIGYCHYLLRGRPTHLSLRMWDSGEQQWSAVQAWQASDAMEQAPDIAERAFRVRWQDESVMTTCADLGTAIACFSGSAPSVWRIWSPADTDIMQLLADSLDG